MNIQKAIENGPVEIVDFPSYKMGGSFHCFLLVHQRLGQSAFLSSMYFHGPWLLWLFKSPEGSGFVIFCLKKIAYFGLKISETNLGRLMCDMTFFR